MPEFGYELPGLPPDYAGGLSAFMPHFGGQAASGRQAYKYDLTGSMGLLAIPAPTTDTVPSPDRGDIANMGTARSSDAPDQWWPQKWFQRVIAERPGAGMPIQMYDPVHPGKTTVLPVPVRALAKDLRAQQAMTARRAILQRVRQLPWWPRVYFAPMADGAGNAPGTGDSGDGSAR